MADKADMLFIEAEKGALERITKALDGLSWKAPTILKDAANATSKYTVEETIREARKRYDYRRGIVGELRKAVRRSGATYANPRAFISVKSKMNDMINYRVSPNKPAVGARRPAAYKGRVLKASPMEVLRKNGVKAFIVRFSNDKEQVMYRVPGKEYKKGLEERRKKHLDTTRIETMKSPSETHMFSKGFDGVKEKAYAELERNTKKYINEFLKEWRGS